MCGGEKLVSNKKLIPNNLKKDIGPALLLKLHTGSEEQRLGNASISKLVH